MSVVYDEIIIDRAQFRCECSYELIKDLGQKTLEQCYRQKLISSSKTALETSD